MVALSSGRRRPVSTFAQRVVIQAVLYVAIIDPRWLEFFFAQKVGGRSAWRNRNRLGHRFSFCVEFENLVFAVCRTKVRQRYGSYGKSAAVPPPLLGVGVRHGR
jgi:hypothetical protein